MQQYQIRPEGIKEIKKRSLIRIIPIMILAAIGGIVIALVSTKGRSVDMEVILFMILLIAVSFTIGIYSALNRLKKLFESYRLTITDSMVIREQQNTPRISIYFNDIKEIVKNGDGSFQIKGKYPSDVILVPAQIENHDQLEQVLTQLKTPSAKANQLFSGGLRGFLVILAFGSMFCVYLVDNKIIVALSGTVCVAIMIWSLIQTQRSKNIDARTRRGMWWVLVVLFAVITATISKLVGMQL